ncbi:hypothetical protein D9M69_715210 [compost metagenome]
MPSKSFACSRAASRLLRSCFNLASRVKPSGNRSAICSPMADTMPRVSQPAKQCNNTLPPSASVMLRLGLRSSCAGQQAIHLFKPFGFTRSSVLKTCSAGVISGPA